MRSLESFNVWESTGLSIVSLLSFIFALSLSPDPLSESQAQEGKVGGPNWSGGSDCRGGLFADQHSRPRAFSQSAVHTLEQRERDMEKVCSCNR